MGPGGAGGGAAAAAQEDEVSRRAAGKARERALLKLLDGLAAQYKSGEAGFASPGGLASPGLAKVDAAAKEARRALAAAVRADAEQVALGGGKAEQSVWRYCFHKRVQLFRGALRALSAPEQRPAQRRLIGEMLHFLDEGAQLYGSLLEALEAAQARARAAAPRGATDMALREAVGRCCMYLGDLARYREEAKHEDGERGGAAFYQAAEVHYRNSVFHAPHEGTAHNALGVLAARLTGKGLVVLYRYARSAMARRPFDRHQGPLLEHCRALLAQGPEQGRAARELLARHKGGAPVLLTLTSSERTEVSLQFGRRLQWLVAACVVQLLLPARDEHEHEQRARPALDLDLVAASVQLCSEELALLLRKWAVAKDAQLSMTVVLIHLLGMCGGEGAGKAGAQRLAHEAAFALLAVVCEQLQPSSRAAPAKQPGLLSQTGSLELTPSMGALGEAAAATAGALDRVELLGPQAIFLDWLRATDGAGLDLGSPAARRLWAALAAVAAPLALWARAHTAAGTARALYRGPLPEEAELEGFAALWQHQQHPHQHIDWDASRLFGTTLTGEEIARLEPTERKRVEAQVEQHRLALRAYKVRVFVQWLERRCGAELLEQAGQGRLACLCAEDESEEELAPRSAASTIAEAVLADDAVTPMDQHDEVIVLTPQGPFAPAQQQQQYQHKMYELDISPAHQLHLQPPLTPFTGEEQPQQRSSFTSIGQPHPHPPPFAAFLLQQPSPYATAVAGPGAGAGTGTGGAGAGTGTGTGTSTRAAAGSFQLWGAPAEDMLSPRLGLLPAPYAQQPASVLAAPGAPGLLDPRTFSSNPTAVTWGSLSATTNGAATPASSAPLPVPLHNSVSGYSANPVMRKGLFGSASGQTAVSGAAAFGATNTKNKDRSNGSTRGAS